MNDTHPKINLYLKKIIMSKSPEQRLIMGCSMFDSAKQIVKSAIISQEPGITAKKMKEKIFLRFYGMEFDKTRKEKILNALMSRDD